MLVLWYHSVTGRQVKKKGMKRMTKLSNSISVAEMMHMRNEEGLSNGEIAKRLGIHINTVIKYIGKHPDGKRARRKPKSLPTLTEKTEVPETPRKSFAERCEEALGEPMVLHTLKHDYAARKEAEELSKKLDNFSPDLGILPQRIYIPEDVQPRALEDMARLAYERRTLENRKANANGNSHIPELVAIFGHDAVITWLKVSLYDMGIPDCRPMNRQKMLETLKLMNDGGTSV